MADPDRGLAMESVVEGKGAAAAATEDRVNAADHWAAEQKLDIAAGAWRRLVQEWTFFDRFSLHIQYFSGNLAECASIIGSKFV